jgi:hypothetical protein
MKKYIIIAYGLLIFYTLVHLFTNFMNQDVLNSIINMQVDPLIFAVFNLLGIFPFAFLMFAFATNKLNKIDYLPLLLAFGLGGFANTPFFIYKDIRKIRYIKYFNVLATIGVILTFITILSGLMFGSITIYRDTFLNDSFVHIMTIDFLFMIIISPLILKPVSNYYLLGLLPIIGIFAVIFIEQNRLSRNSV